MSKSIQPFEPIDTTTNSTVASVSVSEGDEVTTTQTFEIKQPEVYKKEFYVYLRSSDIRKVRDICENAKRCNRQVK